MPSMTAPSAATISTSSQTGTTQLPQVMPGSSRVRTAGSTSRSTEAGRLAVVRLTEISQQINAELLAPLDIWERVQLADLLARVVHHHTGHPTEPAEAVG